jgi:hypothetical protein
MCAVGVDSMVISKILAVLRPVLHFDEMLSVHLDYSNRPESAEEAAFVKQYAERLGFVHRERVVSEVKRGVTDRSEYEKISRQIRYDFYKEVLRSQLGAERMQPDGSADDSDICLLATGRQSGRRYQCGVIFGHHIGDVQENVISNMMR